MHRLDGCSTSTNYLESLEFRRLLTTASVDLSHVLQIVGTKGNDTIVVNRLANGKVSVTGVATQFRPGSGGGQFNKINITTGDGNDRFTISSNVPYTSATLSGGAGNDTLNCGVGNDLLIGGDANDTLNGGAGGSDVISGGAGFDTANYSTRTDNLSITLDGKANDGAKGGAEKDNVQTEEVITGSGDDLLIGSSADDFLAGGAGNDTMKGMGGHDDLIGCTGADQIFGGEGDDFIQAKNQDRDTVNGGSNSDGSIDLDLASVDSIDMPGRAASSAPDASGDESVSDIELFVTDDEVAGIAPLQPLTERLMNLTTWSLLYVRGQPNSLGQVVLTAGNNGNTILFKNATIDGEPSLLVNINGVDLPYVSDTTTRFSVTSGSGNDLIQASDRVRVPLLIHAGGGNDTVIAGARSDTVFGEDGDDSISGGRQNDVLLGGDGNDTLFGEDGRDILIGGEQVDHLYGGRGEDILIGGRTAFDFDANALGSIMDEWNSPASSDTRIDHLRNGGGLNDKFILTTDFNSGATVLADKGNNFLNGGSDRDWFFARDTDTVKQGKGEVVDKV